MKFGLIGFPLGHSFSKKYFSEKFEQLALPHSYDAHPIENIVDVMSWINENPDLKGFNITIPHKIDIIPLLNNISAEAEKIGAVNCVKIQRQNGKITLNGFNTDAYGFENSLKPILKPNHKNALILGNGGATRAVQYVLEKLGIEYKVVSRAKSPQTLTYSDLNQNVFLQHSVIINCTPLGTYPNIEAHPDICFDYINKNYLLYDLIYNPAETVFLQKGKEQGAIIKNGYEMLVLQAERSWEIWNDPTL